MVGNNDISRRETTHEELVEIGTRAAAAEMIATGTTYACDMYYYTQTVGETLAETGVRATLCGPITDGLTPNFKPALEMLCVIWRV